MGDAGPAPQLQPYRLQMLNQDAAAQRLKIKSRLPAKGE